MGGLPCPRPPCEIIDGKVFDKFGEDRTEKFQTGAEIALELCKKYKVQIAILKQGSPSCGTKQIYDGSFTGKKISGMGVTAKLFSENKIKVVGEEDIEF